MFKMLKPFIFIIIVINVHCIEDDLILKVDPGARICLTESASAGQMMEVQYQVIDGRHGELDISFDMLDPNSTLIVTDYKRQKNAIIRDIELTGDYTFCFDNTFSRINYKSVFFYILIENKDEYQEVKVDIGEDGTVLEQTLEWISYYENGTSYRVEINHIANAMTKILKHVVRARHLLDMYAALRSTDTHLAFKDTFIIDVWSGFQISFMLLVGLVQVYMIKSLFNRPSDVHPFL